MWGNCTIMSKTSTARIKVTTSIRIIPIAGDEALSDSQQGDKNYSSFFIINKIITFCTYKDWAINQGHPHTDDTGPLPVFLVIRSIFL
jgi:hypothetical protein